VKPRGWDITWGAQIDPRVVRLTGGGEVTDTKVAAYLAKYATKSTEPVEECRRPPEDLSDGVAGLALRRDGRI